MQYFKSHAVSEHTILRVEAEKNVDGRIEDVFVSATLFGKSQSEHGEYFVNNTAR